MPSFSAEEQSKDQSSTGLWRALRHRNYRLFFAGQAVSLIGTWITNVASGWLVYRLTHSELLLGLVSFASQFPSFLLAPFAGVLIDRWNRKHVLIATQVASCIQSTALAVLTLTGVITVPMIIALSIFQALINAFDMPARHAFVSEMVRSRSDLSNAIALNSAMFNGARLIGPAVGGGIISLWGEGICFAIDAVSFAAVIAALLAIQVTPRIVPTSGYRVWEGLMEGAMYAMRAPLIRQLLTVVALVSFLVSPHIVLMPVFAEEILHGGPQLLGILMGASGCGALLGALALAARPSSKGFAKVIRGAGLVLGFGLLGFSLSQQVWLTLPIVFLIGAAFIMLLAACNTVIQTVVDDTKRARVMSFYMMAFIGMMPLGSLCAGWLAHQIGTPHTVTVAGVLCLGGVLLFGRHLPELRRMIDAHGDSGNEGAPTTERT